MAIREDIIDGAAIRETDAGYEAVRVFVVDELTGSNSAVLYAALTHPNVPGRGDAHPSIPGVSAVERSAAPIRGSLTAARVTVTYRPLTGSDVADEGTPTMEVGATLGATCLQV